MPGSSRRATACRSASIDAICPALHDPYVTQNRIVYAAVVLALLIAVAIAWHFTHVPSTAH